MGRMKELADPDLYTAQAVERVNDAFDKLDALRGGRYPSSPGFKERGGTSQAAAVAVGSTSAANRERVLTVLRANPAGLTADEIADRLRMDKLAVRPRVSELSTGGLIEKTGERRKNDSGLAAWVWRIKK